MVVFEKTAIIEDLAKNDFIEVYKFPREDGSAGRLHISPSRARRWNVMADDLRNKNIAPELCNKDTIEAVTAQSARQRFAYAPATGWTAEYNAFVLQTRAVGGTISKHIRGISPDRHVLAATDRRATGSSEIWRKTVARKALESSAIMFTISLAFAAPLLRLTNEQSFAVCLSGKTRGGKTVACLAGESVAGIGQMDKLLSWNATGAGLEPALPSHNDLLLVIDDLNKLQATSDADRYQKIKDFSYNLATGSIRRRSQMHSNADDNGAGYRLIVLTSAEESIQSLALKAGASRTGDAIRLINVPAYFDGHDHIFDRVDPIESLDQNQLRQRYAELVSACSANHGYVFLRYLRHLMANLGSAEQKVGKLRSVFVKQVLRKTDPIEFADLARKFSLVYAGGALANNAVKLGWKRVDILETISKCYRAAADELLPERKLLPEGLAILGDWLMDLPKTEAANCDDIDGFVTESPSANICLVKVDSFNRLFANVRQRQLVLDDLLDHRQIDVARSISGPRHPKEQFSWPDGKRRRSYRILWKMRADIMAANTGL